MTDFGVLMFPTDYAIAPHVLASEAEARGFESIFFPEHTHIPASRKTPWPGGAELPREYAHTHDPFVALTAAAAVTQSIKLATGICLVTERDPILMAKQVASLDLLSGGRVVLGIGAGWNVEEMANHGIAFATRWKVPGNACSRCGASGATRPPSFHGEFVRLRSDLVVSEARGSKAGPPVPVGCVVGAGAPGQRIAEYCDGWMPIFQGHTARGGIRRNRLSGRRSQQGLTKPGAPRAAAAHRSSRSSVCRRIAPASRNSDRFRFHSPAFGLPPADADTAIPLLDKLAELAGSLQAA